MRHRIHFMFYKVKVALCIILNKVKRYSEQGQSKIISKLSIYHNPAFLRVWSFRRLQLKLVFWRLARSTRTATSTSLQPSTEHIQCEIYAVAETNLLGRHLVWNKLLSAEWRTSFCRAGSLTRGLGCGAAYSEEDFCWYDSKKSIKSHIIRDFQFSYFSQWGGWFDGCSHNFLPAGDTYQKPPMYITLHLENLTLEEQYYKTPTKHIDFQPKRICETLTDAWVIYTLSTNAAASAPPLTWFPHPPFPTWLSPQVDPWR